jgi:hypothetical protein
VTGALAATSAAGWTLGHGHVYSEGLARIKWDEAGEPPEHREGGLLTAYCKRRVAKSNLWLSVALSDGL